MSSVDPALSVDVRRHFLQAVRRVLRPIIRLMIRHGVAYTEFADVARGAYVESAIRDRNDQTSKPTRDQIARLTGIPRQQVDHYIDDEDALPRAQSTTTPVMAEVLHRWHTDPHYLGPNGSPRDLELDARSGLSFQRLVAQVNSAISPALVLDELLKAKSVAYTDKKRIRAITRYFIWRAGSLSSIEHFGVTLAQFTSTLEYNLNPDHAKHKRLERFVFTDRGLAAKLLPDFQKISRERSDQFLLELDDWLARFSDTDENQAGTRVETGIEVFSYVEMPQDTKPLSTLIQPRRNAASPGPESTGSS